MNNNQSMSSISFKGSANQTLFNDVDTRAAFSLRIGLAAGALSTGSSNVFVGTYAGRLASPTATLAVGTYAGEATTGTRLVLVGNEAGRYASASDSVLIGEAAGKWLSGSDVVLLGGFAAGSATLTGGQHVIVGAHAAEFGAGAGVGDTFVGYAAGQRLAATGGCNVGLGMGAASGASNVRTSVLIGYGVAAAASNLSRSVVIGSGAGTRAGGDANVIVGGGAAPAVLAGGSCNVVLGEACDTIAPMTSTSVTVGLASASADGSVSVGADVTTSRYYSTSVGNAIDSMSDNAVSIGGGLTVNAVTVFSDPLNVYATPDPASGNFARIVYNAQRSGESDTLSYGYENIANTNTSRSYQNAIGAVDSSLFPEFGRPYVLELGTTFAIDDDALFACGVQVRSAAGDLRASVFAPGGAVGVSVNVGSATLDATGVVSATVASPLAMEASAQFFNDYRMVGAASSNFVGLADSYVRWKVYLPKRLGKPYMPAATLAFAGVPFQANFYLASNALWTPALAVNDVLGGTSGLLTAGGPTRVWLTKAPAFGVILGGRGVFPAASPMYASYNYCLPDASTLTDTFAVRAAHYPAVGDLAVPADDETVVTLTYAAKQIGFATGSAFPVMADAVTQSGFGCPPIFYGTAATDLTVFASAPVFVAADQLAVGSPTPATTFHAAAGDWGYGLCGLSLDPAAPVPIGGGAELTFVCGTFSQVVPVNAYVSDAIASAAACNVVVTQVPACGVAQYFGAPLTPGAIPSVAWGAPAAAFAYTCLDALSVPAAGEAVTLVANPAWSSNDASAQWQVAFPAPAFVHVQDVTVVTAFGGSSASTTAVQDLGSTAFVAFPASNVTVVAGAMAVTVATPLAAPAATFTVTSNVVVVASVMSSQVSTATFFARGGTGGCNVTTYVNACVYGTYASNMATTASTTARTDGVVVAVTSNVTYVTAAKYASTATMPTSAYTLSVASWAVGDSFSAWGGGSLLYTSNYAWAPPAPALVATGAPSSNYVRFTSNVAYATSNAYVYDYAPVTPDHAFAQPAASNVFALASALPTAVLGGASVDLLNVAVGHSTSNPAFGFSAADVAAGRVFVRPRCPGASGQARLRVTYANGAAHVVSAFVTPTRATPSATTLSLFVGSNLASPMAPVAMDRAAVAAALPPGWSSNATARLFIQPTLAPRPGFWSAASSAAVALPDLSTSLVPSSPPFYYHYGRATGLYGTQAFTAVAAVGTDVSGWTWTAPFTLAVGVAVARAAPILYNAGITLGPQALTPDVVSVPGATRYTVASASSPGVALSLSTFTPADVAAGNVRITVASPQAADVFATIALTTDAAPSSPLSLPVVPYWRSAYPTAPLAIAFHHDGTTSSNVVDPALLAFASGAMRANVALPSSNALMLVLVPPQSGYLTLDGNTALMQVPLNQCASLRYVAVGSGANDAVTVRFTHGAGQCGATASVVTLRHYVYTSPGVYAASNLPLTHAETPQYSAGYLADGMPARVLPAATSNLWGWYSRVALEGSGGATVSYTLDRADRVLLTSTAFMNTFAFDPTQAASIRVVLMTNPAHGVIVRGDAFAPVRYIEWSDVMAGAMYYYQHDGSAATVDPDVVQVCVSSHAYDLDTSRLFVLQFHAVDQPAMTVNATEVVYGRASNVVEALSSTFLAATASPTFFHVTSTVGLSNLPATFASSNLPAAVVITSNVANFGFIATRAWAVSPVMTHPFYAAQLSQTHRFGFNVALSCNVVTQKNPIYNITYDYGGNDPGFVDRVVGASFAFYPEVDYDPPQPALAALVAPLKKFTFSLRFGSAPFDTDVVTGDPVLAANASCVLTLTQDALVVTTASGAETLAWPTPPTLNAWNVLTFRNVNPASTAVYVDLNRVALPTATPPVDFAGVRVVEFVYASSSNVFGNVIGNAIGGVPGEVLILNPLTAIGLRSFALTVSMFASTGGLATYVGDVHNVIVGQNIMVNGIDNIAIGRAFSSSGDGSIIVGTQIGVAATAAINAIASSLYQCIIIGKGMFAGTVMANVTAMGRNIMNDIGALGVSLADLNHFAAQYPIIIGNDVSASMMGYQVNVGSTFLRGTDGRVYLGVAGEQVCVGTNAGATQAAPSDAALVVSGAVQNATGANQFVVYVASAFPDAGGGWVASIASSTANLAVAPASSYADPAVVGVVVAFPSPSTAALQASGVASVWVCDYGGGSNLPVGTLVCACPVPGCAAAQWSTGVTSATVGKLLQPCNPRYDIYSRTVSTSNLASSVKCLLRMG